MHKFSYKTLFIIFFFLLIGVVVLLRFVFPSQKVSAAWWNDSWSYRQAINISSHNTNESNVYIITTVNIGTTTKSQIDNGDFRFITQSGDLLPYYISAGTGTTAPTFHIQFSSFPSGAQTIYAYYGNSSVANGFSAADFTTQASNYTIGSLSAEELSPAPIAYWKFDEGVGTTVYDSTSNQNNGVFGTGNSAPTWATEDQCISGKCLSFNGTSNLLVLPSVSNIKSISMWVYINDGQLNGNWKYLFDARTGLVNGYFANYQYGNDIGSNWTTMYVNGINKAVSWDNIPTGQWIHLYFESDTIFTDDINLMSKFSNDERLAGKIDEVKFYPYARTAAQIKLDFNSRGSKKGSSVNLGVKSSTAPDLSTKLLDYWKFDNFLNNSVSNRSSATGAIGGSAAYTVSGQKNQSLDFTELDTGNFTYISGNTFQDAGQNWGTNSLVGYQFGTDYGPNNEFCQGTITSNTSTNITFSTSCSSWGGNKYYRIKKSIYINGPVSTHPTDKISASLWFKSNGSQYARIARATNEFVHLTIDTASVAVGAINYTNSIAYNTNPHDGKWHYLAIVYDGSTQKIYYDGLFRNSNSLSGALPSGGSLTIGSRNDGDQEFFNGLIDEVKIYNTALTADEIKQDYNQGSAVVFGSTNQTIGGTTTSLEYCIPGDTSPCSLPVAEWNFEENTGTSAKDISGNNNTGTFGTGNSAPTWTVGKKNTGAGVNFDGNDYINSGTSPSLNITGAITLSAWVKVGEDTQPNYSRIVAKNWFYSLEIYSTNKVLLDFQDGAPSIGTLTSNTALISGTWYYVVGTYDPNGGANNFKIYINGIIDKQSTATGVIPTNSTSPLVIGALSSINGYFNGKLDNIRIYNYARTPAQIAYDYNKGAPVAWWKFDECEGIVAHDSAAPLSGVGNTGTITIGASGTQNSLGTCQVGTSAAWTNGASGKINASLNFDGTDDEVALAPNTFNNLAAGANAVSTSVWFKITNQNISSNPLLRFVIDGTAASNQIRINYGGGSNYYLGYGGRSCIGDGYVEANIDISPNIGQWTHFAGVQDFTNDKIIFYLNGKFIGSASVSYSCSVYAPGTSTYSDYIGKHQYAGTYLYGQVDDLRLYNYALTPEQVKTIYNNGAVNFN